MDGLIGWLGGAYLWVKAFHIIFVIFWMAGLFILPRYLVHHSATAPGSPEARLADYLRPRDWLAELA